MGPEKPLPIDASFTSPEEYISSLLNLITTSKLVRTLCGGVHMLEFFTFEPGLYTAILPETWRDFFSAHDIMDVLDLLMREDLDRLDHGPWKTSIPPKDLLEYIRTVRRHTLDHRFDGPEPTPLTREVALGMGVKKVHEVGQFTSYISRLTEDLAAASPDSSITHIIDLGSGQGYLPRALASPPHDHTVVGVESREHNVTGSQNWDILAKLAPKPAPIMRNKKIYKEELAQQRANGTVPVKIDPSKRDRKGDRGFFSHPGLPNLSIPADREDVNVSCMPTSQGAVQYVSHYLLDGDLTRITSQILAPSSLDTIRHNASLDPEDKRLLPRAAPGDIRALVIGLHACGNLTHHGLRSLLLTPSVRAVALVGCCYNLLTERLGPPTFKLDSLRGRNTRLEVQQNSHDPHGFPMSDRFCNYPSPLDGPNSLGVRLNITARMMAVQAPRNWTRNDSEGFFRRHFYRALLQRVFVDLGLVPAPRPDWGARATSTTQEVNENGESQDSAPATDPVILGSLPRKSYASFLSYVRAASAKLGRHETHPTFSVERARAFSDALAGMSDEDVQGYEEKYAHRKKELEVVWSLMAFTAGVVEAAIVTDRWCWVREQGVRGWVEAVFGYGVSPRNMVVVGVKD
ncbi:methyltransferase domain-containing protein [Elsinoe ampelina]|uniref:Methyltransferase domain-containing protein n=1 Tax=Elsinoe ampelina TaxID=302913 RepID=A0A6A6G514_9PEZI|nr:methyltransferase domain-containing protein [Elsinoe ampelina]